VNRGVLLLLAVGAAVAGFLWFRSRQQSALEGTGEPIAGTPAKKKKKKKKKGNKLSGFFGKVWKAVKKVSDNKIVEAGLVAGATAAGGRGGGVAAAAVLKAPSLRGMGGGCPGNRAPVFFA
jgi:hypothetical protein